MNKKLLSILLAVALLITTLPLSVITVSAESYSGTCGDNLTWSLDTETGVLDIEGSGAMTNWSSYSSTPWYSYLDYIKSVIIGNGVTTIGEYAFKNCSNLTSINIPDSVVCIGSFAFENDNLTAIYITDIAKWCEMDFSFSYPLSFAENLYLNGELVTNLVIPDGVTKISSHAFLDYSKLTSVIIPDSVTKIGSQSFYGCGSLTSVTIPDSVVNIDSYAFYGCSSLTSITIPDSVTSIGTHAFWNCSKSLESINVGNGNTVYHSNNNCLIETATNTLILGCKNSIIPADGSVTSIGNFAFYNCSSLTSITIPDSVTSIGNSAFYNCSSLTSVTIGDGVTSIGGSAFSGCSSLTSVTIPNSVTSIGDTAFSYCSSLASIAIPDSVTSIDERAFERCIALATVTIGNGITKIANSMFYDCNSLLEITIPDSVLSIGESAFARCSSLTTITVGNGVTSIGDDAFLSCDSLTAVYITDIAKWCKINFYEYTSNPLFNTENLYLNGEIITDLVIPDGVRNIGKYAFYNCSKLTTITVPNGVISIGDSAFYGCVNLTLATIPDSVKNIGYDAFWGCYNLIFNVSLNSYAYNYAVNKDIDLTVGSFGADGDNLTWNFNPENGTLTISGNGDMENWKHNWSSGAITTPWSSCYNYIKTIIIDDGITSIGDDAFFNCTSVTSVSIPDSVTSIGNYAFTGCSGLTSVHITDIAKWCEIEFAISTCNPLYYAKNLYLNGELVTDLIIPGGVTSISGYAFYNCSSVVSVTIPNSISSIGNFAFYGCSGLTLVTIPDGVTEIGDSAFEGCIGLTSITIPDSVTSIGGDAFDDCDNLTITASADSYAITFARNNSIPYTTYGSFGVDGNNLTWRYNSKNGTLTINGNGDMNDWSSYSSVPWYSICSSIKSVIISDGVTSIGNSAFEGCRSLSSITIPDSVTSIGDYAFDNCDTLTAVYITDIAKWCEIEFLWFSSNPLCYAENLYLNGELVTDLVIPDGITSIGSFAFEGCSSLTSVTIPDSVTEIGNFAFSDCYTLTAVYITDIAKWCEIKFLSSSSNPLYCAENLYLNGELITDLVIPDSVTSIGDYAFYDCSSLTSITIPDSVTSIGSSAFYGCSNLTLAVKLGSYAHTYAISNNLPYIPLGNVVSIAVSALPDKTIYPIAGRINTTGLVVTATFDDGTTGDITAACVIGECDTSTAGVKTVTVSYGDFTCSFEITVDADLIEYPESDHPYANNTNQTWTYTHNKPADSLKITFSSDTEVENYYDEIYIYNADGSQQGVYTGTQLAGKTVEVTGNSFSIKLTSDGSVNKYGFTITNIEGVGGSACAHTNIETRNATAATCTSDGYTGDTYCTDCGELISSGSVISATGHSYIETVVDSTYTEQGYKTTACKLCGDVQSTESFGYALCDINKDGYVNEDDLNIYSSGLIPDDFDAAVLDFDSDGEQSTFDTQIFTRLANGIDMDVMADANGDGKTSLSDMLRIKKMLADSAVLGNADFNGTGGVDADDLAFAKRFLLMVR